MLLRVSATAPFEAITQGIGDQGELHDAFGIDGDVDERSGLYRGFGVAGNIVGGFALGGSLASKAAFRGPEYGRWKDAGVWQEGWHFHLGSGGGLSKHHLPQQLGKWLKNAGSIIRRRFK